MTPKQYAKKRGLTITLTQAGKINKVQTYSPDGLYKLFHNPNDTNHQKFNSIVDSAQEEIEKIS